MKQTTTPVNYDFNKSYYENFIYNRRAGIIATGKINVVFKKLLLVNATPEAINTIDCMGTLDCKAYIKETYDGSTPDCIADQLWENLEGLVTGEWNSEGIRRLFGENNDIGTLLGDIWDLGGETIGSIKNDPLNVLTGGAISNSDVDLNRSDFNPSNW